MKNCHSCGFGNKDTAKFCVKCGNSLDRRCPACGEEIDEEDVFCPSCGARLDGKKICPVCRTENEDSDKFCSVCGATLSRESSNPVNRVPAPVVSEKSECNSNEKRGRNRRILDRVLTITRAGLILALSLTMFILSFFGATKSSVTLSDFGFSSSDSLNDLPISVEITTIDIIEGAFARIDPKSSEEVFKDFMSYMAANLSASDYQAIIGSGSSSGTDYYRLLHSITKIMEDYNILKLTAMREFVEISPADTTELWIQSAFALVYIILSFTFFVMSVLDFIRTLQGKKKKNTSFFTVGALSLAAAVGFSCTLALIFGGKTASCLAAFIALAVISLALDLAYRIFSGECVFKVAKIPQYVSAAAGIVLVVILLFLAGGSMISLTFTYGNSTFRSGYDVSELAQAWNYAKLALQDKTMYGSAEEYFSYNSMFSTISTKELYSPAITGVIGLMAIENALSVVGILLELVTVGFIVVSVLTIIDRVRAVRFDRGAKLVYTVLLPVFSVLVLALAIAYSFMVNKTMNGFNSFEYTTKISGVLIALVVLAFIETIQRIVFHALSARSSKKEEKSALPAEQVSA